MKHTFKTLMLLGAVGLGVVESWATYGFDKADMSFPDAANTTDNTLWANPVVCLCESIPVIDDLSELKSLFGLGDDIVKLVSSTKTLEKGKDCALTLVIAYVLADADDNKETFYHAQCIKDTLGPTFKIVPFNDITLCVDPDGNYEATVNRIVEGVSISELQDDFTKLEESFTIFKSITFDPKEDKNDGYDTDTNLGEVTYGKRTYSQVWSVTDSCGNTTRNMLYIHLYPLATIRIDSLGTQEITYGQDIRDVLIHHQYSNLALHPQNSGGINLYNTDTTGTLRGMPDSAGTFIYTLRATSWHDCNIVDTTATFTVKPRPITITANNVTKVYDGKPLTSNNYICTLTPPFGDINNNILVPGDSIASVTIIGSQTHVGTNLNTPSNARITICTADTVDKNPSYDITYVPGTLTVTPKQLTSPTIITGDAFEVGGATLKPDIRQITVKDDDNVLDPGQYTVGYKIQTTSQSGDYVWKDIAATDITIPGTYQVIISNTENSNYDIDYTKTISVSATLGGSETTLGRSDAETWYQIENDISYANGITLEGDVNLILADGVIMTVGTTDSPVSGTGIKSGNNRQYSLTIHSQAAGTGKLIVNATGNGIEVKNLTIKGGQVRATTTTNTSGYGLGCNALNLDWDIANPSTSVYINRASGDLNIADNKIFQSEDGTQFYESANPASAINGLTLTPYGYKGKCGNDLYWEYVIGGTTLTFSGSGSMWNFDNAPAPWKGIGFTAADFKNVQGKIGRNAFADCTSLTNVDIPATVNEIQDNAFTGCTNLKAVTMRSTTPPSLINSFEDCTGLKAIFVPSEEIYNTYCATTMEGWTHYKSILVPETLTLPKNLSGWSTYCHNYILKYNPGEGVTAHTVSGLSDDGKSVATTAVTGNLVAPGIPLLLNFTGSSTGDITMTPDIDASATPSMTAIVDNGSTGSVVFYGNASNSALGADALNGYVYALGNTAGKQSYILYDGEFVLVYSISDEGIAAHRCWLNVSTLGPHAAPRLEIGGDATGGLTLMEEGRGNMEDVWYDLNGRKVNNPTAKGIYINRHRKVVIK